MSVIFGEVLTLGQERGGEVRLRVFGDEHYARYETLDGYTVIYDAELGVFCYAALPGNRFQSTRVAVDQPPPAGLARHLQESLSTRDARTEDRRMLRAAATKSSAPEPQVVRTFGPNQGLLEGRQLSIGSVRGLTILVDFQDVTSSVTRRRRAGDAQRRQLHAQRQHLLGARVLPSRLQRPARLHATTSSVPSG